MVDSVKKMSISIQNVMSANTCSVSQLRKRPDYWVLLRVSRADFLLS